MTKLYIKIVAAVVILAMFCGCFFMLDKAESKITLPEPEKIENSILLVTKPYPLNDWDYVENPGGYFFDERYPEYVKEETKIVKPVLHNSPPIVQTPVVVPTTEPITEEDKVTEENSTEIIEETSSAVEGESEDTTAETTTESPAPQYIIKASHYAVPAEEIYFIWPVRQYTDEQKTLLAKMLYCEAGGEGWDCQVATLSGIINHIEYNSGNFGVLDKGNHFSPASYYRYKTPTNMNWEVLDYVLNGHLIADVKYFQLYGYHSFGTPMFCVGGIYFSR